MIWLGNVLRREEDYVRNRVRSLQVEKTKESKITAGRKDKREENLEGD